MSNTDKDRVEAVLRLFIMESGGDTIPVQCFNEATTTLLALITDARINELKQLEPSEQFEEYAKLMGSEYCLICGFNAIAVRKYIRTRIKELKGKEEIK